MWSGSADELQLYCLRHQRLGFTRANKSPDVSVDQHGSRWLKYFHASNPDADLDGFTVAFGSAVPTPPGPFITTNALPNATVGFPYNRALQETGVASALWFGSGLPPGLTLDESSGLVTGTPTAAGAYSFSVYAEDANNRGAWSQTQTLSLAVDLPLLQPQCVYSPILHMRICW